jgi:hypothetical protein
MRHDQAFDGIDWSKAAPSWASIFTGLVLPLLALALLVVSIDLAFGWLFERWVGSSSMSPVLLAAIMFLPALLSAFCCCKLFLYLKERWGRLRDPASAKALSERIDRLPRRLTD